MAQVVNNGSLVKVIAPNHARLGQAGAAIGGSVAPDHATVDIKFDVDQKIETVHTDDLQVLGS